MHPVFIVMLILLALIVIALIISVVGVASGNDELSVLVGLPFASLSGILFGLILVLWFVLEAFDKI